MTRRKGNAEGVVLVGQRGGINVAQSRYEVDNDVAPLGAGQRYLFATRFDATSHSRLALTGYGMLRLGPVISPGRALAIFDQTKRLVS
jgi:hypothetical protein